MQIAPKNQLTSEVELYAKFFFSADNVASLVTDNGVEDQFAQRFSLIDKHDATAIDDREVFSRDSGAYRRAVVAYMAQTINARVDEYVALGRAEADRQATAVLRDFHERYGLANFAERFSESMAEVGREFAEWENGARYGLTSNRYEVRGHVYIRNATRELEDFLYATRAQEQIPALKKRKADIFRVASVDGRGYASHTVQQASFKAVRIQ